MRDAVFLQLAPRCRSSPWYVCTEGRGHDVEGHLGVPGGQGWFSGWWVIVCSTTSDHSIGIYRGTFYMSGCRSSQRNRLPRFEVRTAVEAMATVTSICPGDVVVSVLCWSPMRSRFGESSSQMTQ